MALLKEDGNLNIEWINKLPIEKHCKVVASLTRKQMKVYLSKQPINESKIILVPFVLINRWKSGEWMQWNF